MKRLKFIALLVLCATALTLGFGAYSGGVDVLGASKNSDGPTDPDLTSRPIESREERREMPEHVKFMFLFHHLQKIRDNQSALFDFRERTKLANHEFDEIVQLAQEHEVDTSRLDSQAKLIIDAFHANYPPGRMPRGTVPPPPPQELLDLQEVRNQTTLQYRDRLRARLGDQGNQILGEFLETEFRPRAISEPPTRKKPPTLNLWEVK